MRREGREPLPDHAGESPLLSRSGGEKGLRGSGAGTLGPPLLALGSPVFHSIGEGKLGVSLESLQGQRDLIYCLAAQTKRWAEGIRVPAPLAGQRKRCRDPRCSPRGNPACRGTFGGRRKAVRDRLVSLRGEGSCGGGGAPRDSAGSGATEEGLTSMHTQPKCNASALTVTAWP